MTEKEKAIRTLEEQLEVAKQALFILASIFKHFNESIL